MMDGLTNGHNLCVIAGVSPIVILDMSVAHT